MGRIVITHVGTSALEVEDKAMHNNPPRGYKDTVDQLRRHEEPSADRLTEWKEKLLAGLREVWGATSLFDNIERRQKSPAEIASLSALGVEPGDHLILLHSETPGGRFCAALLEHVLRQNVAPDSEYPYYGPDINITVAQVDGLWVSGEGTRETDEANSADTFVREGMVKYVEAVWEHYCNRQGGDSLIFNITGGYKGMIPIARDLSMLLEGHSRKTERAITSEVCYLYQSSEGLIRYAALPMWFDWETNTPQDIFPPKLKKKLLTADEEGKIRAQLIGELERGGFMEKPGDPGFVQLSPLGRILLTIIRKVDHASTATPSPANH